MSKNKKILLYGESSTLSSGYGVYAYNLLTQLSKNQDYVLAECGTYSDNTDPRIKSFPWKHYPTRPLPDTPEWHEYHSRPSYQFGEYVCDDVLLDFRPDTVISLRDFWMEDYLFITPGRKYFNHIHLAPVDSNPQKNEWLTSFAQCEKVLTYSDYGLDVLKKEGCGNLPLSESAFAGVDTSVFNPKDRIACRKSLGVPENAFVIGSTMRNQVRKQFFELFKSFANFLETAPAPIANNAYLYTHTKVPDIGWPLDSFIRELGIGHRVIFTYVCQNCRAVFASLYRGGRATCKACSSHSMYMPSLMNAVSPLAFSHVFNCFDIYVQFANCEGFGMPMVEAAACGIPVMAIDYSAMSDIVRKLGGIPLKVKGMFRDLGVDADRAYPDNEDFVQKLIDYARLPPEMRLRYKNAALDGVARWFTWEAVTERWTRAIDSVGYGSWDAPPDIHEPPCSIPEGMSDQEFVRFGFSKIAGRNELNRSYHSTRFQRDLANGFASDGKPISRADLLPQFEALGQIKNDFERKRCGIE